MRKDSGVSFSAKSTSLRSAFRRISCSTYRHKTHAVHLSSIVYYKVEEGLKGPVLCHRQWGLYCVIGSGACTVS